MFVFFVGDYTMLNAAVDQSLRRWQQIIFRFLCVFIGRSTLAATSRGILRCISCSLIDHIGLKQMREKT